LGCLLHLHSRPTAVNLADGADRLRVAAKHAAESAGATAQSVVEAVIKEAEEYFDADLKANKVCGGW
jgi:methylthioribose-1-phosphate isomerase